MDKICHGYISQLPVEDIGGVKQTKCLIRGRNIVLTPEEEVRQAYLHYLLNHSKIDQSLFRIRVEFQSLDIAIYPKYQYSMFSPYTNPSLIVEVKRDGVDLQRHKSQLFRYLDRHSCPKGVLFNCASVHLYTKEGKSYRNESIKIEQLDEIIHADMVLNQSEIEDFKKAEVGDIDCFIRLVEKYGNASRVSFECRTYGIVTSAFWFQVANDHILFDIQGVRAKKKRPRFHVKDFIRLINISESF